LSSDDIKVPGAYRDVRLLPEADKVGQVTSWDPPEAKARRILNILGGDPQVLWALSQIMGEAKVCGPWVKTTYKDRWERLSPDRTPVAHVLKHGNLWAGGPEGESYLFENHPTLLSVKKAIDVVLKERGWVFAGVIKIEVDAEMGRHWLKSSPLG